MMNDDKRPSDRSRNGEDGIHRGGLTLFVTLIFGESWRLLYIFSPSFFFFSFSAILGGWKGKGGGEGGGGY